MVPYLEFVTYVHIVKIDRYCVTQIPGNRRVHRREYSGGGTSEGPGVVDFIVRGKRDRD